MVFFFFVRDEFLRYVSFDLVWIVTYECAGEVANEMIVLSVGTIFLPFFAIYTYLYVFNDVVFLFLPRMTCLCERCRELNIFVNSICKQRKYLKGAACDESVCKLDRHGFVVKDGIFFSHQNIRRKLRLERRDKKIRNVYFFHVLYIFSI